MTDAIAPAPQRSPVTGGAFYRLVWKWHFLASLYVLPFMAMLAVTGGIYLYKPFIEERLYADRLNVEVGTQQQSYEAQLAALSDVTTVTRVRGITTEDQPDRATLIEFDDGNKIRNLAWINPCLLYTSPSPRDQRGSRMPSSA